MGDGEKPLGFLLKGVPHAAAIGMHVVEVKPGEALVRIAYDERFVGNPQTGVIHGGIITTILDNASGIAVSAKLGTFGQIATLDLRIDYMKPATPGEDIFAHAVCYKLTRNVAFVRGTAYHGDRDDPIATSAAVFMLGTKREAGANLKPGEGT